MTPDLRELYQQMILDHAKGPRNYHEMPQATRQASGHNPLCGDRVTVYCQIEGDTVTDVSFDGSGCAICTASSSMMTQFIKGKTIERARDTFIKFRELVMGRLESLDAIEDLEKLAVFSGVRAFPIRVKCATLPWHTLKAALENGDPMVSTE